MKYILSKERPLEALDDLGFPRALIFGFDAEAPLRSYETKVFSYMTHGLGQANDLYDAYILAGNILEELRLSKTQGFINLTPENIIGYLNALHQKIAHTLDRDLRKTIKALYGKDQISLAGRFTNQQVFRWQPSRDITEILCAKFIVEKEKKTNAKLINVSQQLDKILLENPGVLTEQDCKRFIALVKKYQSVALAEQNNFDDNIKEKIAEVAGFEAFFVPLYYLFDLYNHNRLDPNERAILLRIVKPCIVPSAYPEAQNTFACELIRRLRELPLNTLDEQIDLAYFIFSQLTELHFYFNANGRLATCFMNIFLRLCDTPAILIRYPGERTQSQSQYAKAIATIMTEPEYFKNFLRERIENVNHLNSDLLNILNEKEKIFLLRQACILGILLNYSIFQRKSFEYINQPIFEINNVIAILLMKKGQLNESSLLENFFSYIREGMEKLKTPSGLDDKLRQFRENKNWALLFRYAFFTLKERKPLPFSALEALQACLDETLDQKTRKDAKACAKLSLAQEGCDEQTQIFIEEHEALHSIKRSVGLN